MLMPVIWMQEKVFVPEEMDVLEEVFADDTVEREEITDVRHWHSSASP